MLAIHNLSLALPDGWGVLEVLKPSPGGQENNDGVERGNPWNNELTWTQAQYTVITLGYGIQSCELTVHSDNPGIWDSIM